MKPRALSVGIGKDSPFAFDYGWKQLVACGCFSTVVILDQSDARCVQSLQGHRSTVSLISWAPETYYHDHKNPYFLRLASVDTGGTIITWDVVNAIVISEFSEPNCTVSDLAWIINQNVSRDLLLVLHSGGHCVLWNAQTRMQLWKTLMDESFVSFVTDPFSFKNVLFSSSTCIGVVKDFSFTAPFTFKRSTLMAAKAGETGNSTFRIASLYKNATPSPGCDSSPTCAGSSSNLADVTHGECIQVCYHGYRKDCALLVFRRELVIVDLSVLHSVTSILLDRSSASFLRVYSCQQRDVIICLHENGSLSVYARQGLVCPFEPSAHSPSDLSASTITPGGESAPYELVTQTEGSRKNNRQILKLRFTVDRSREVNVSVVASENRIQFWRLRQVPLLPILASKTTVEPCLTLADLVPHEPGLVKPPRLYLQLCSMYVASKTGVTVCRVCPQHFLKPLAAQLGCHALVAVGNNRGGVQIWDMHSGVLWREYQILPVPVLGVEWLTIPRNTDYSDSLHETEGVTNAETTPPIFHLGLIVHGWQPKDRLAGTSASVHLSIDEPKLEGRNHVCLLNLSTGYAQSFRTGFSDGTGGFGLPGLSNRATVAKGEGAFESPIELARISHLGQYLALLVHNECVELWNMVAMKLIKRILFDPGSYGVALDWYQSVTRMIELGSTRSSEMLTWVPGVSSELNQGTSISQSVSPGSNRPRLCHRESFVLCARPQSLRLIIVDGDNTDSTVVSNTILQGLPTFTSERISAVAWFADLLAFGTADGFVAVRDLHAKKTVVRMSSSFGWLSVPDHETGHVDSATSDVRSVLDAIAAVTRYNTGVRRLAFLPGSSTSSRLLTVLYDSLYLWEPREMTLLCAARFDGRLQRCLISADWAYPVSAPTDVVLCIIVGADGALRLVEADGTSMEMIPVSCSSSDSSAINGTMLADQPTTRFVGSSSITSQPDDTGPPFVPSILPLTAALNIRHLLQHQPWRQHGAHSGFEPRSVTGENDNGAESSNFDDDSRSSYEFACPLLAPGFAKIQTLVHRFLQNLQKKPELRKSFVRSSATIVERCLWTAQLFDDFYELQFWRMTASRLLKQSHNPSRYALDLSWNLLADSTLYRNAAVARVRLLEQARLTGADRDYCVHYLVLLGQYERAVSLLLETSPDSPDYTVNMHRACLLASHVRSDWTIIPKAVLTEDIHLSTFKLVATNFLACGQLDRGVELLCLAGLWADACRYLESFDQWERSVWLAKCTLPPKDIDNVLKRWAAHLSSVQINRKDFAVLIYILLDEHNMVLKLLCELRQYQLAARYLEACLQMKVLSWTEAHGELYRTIFYEFAKILLKLGHAESSQYYCDLAGELGKSLKNEIDYSLT